QEFPRGCPELLRQAKAMDRAVAKRDWEQLTSLLHAAADTQRRYYASAETWRTLLIEVVQQLDASHKGLSRIRKKERLERVLEIPATTPEQLQQKLASLVKGWAEASAEATAEDAQAQDAGASHASFTHFSDDAHMLC